MKQQKGFYSQRKQQSEQEGSARPSVSSQLKKGQPIYQGNDLQSEQTMATNNMASTVHATGFQVQTRRTMMGSIRGSQDGKSSNSHSRERQLQMQMEYLNAIHGQGQGNVVSRQVEQHNPQSQFLTSFGHGSIGAEEVFERASSSQRNAHQPTEL